MSTLPLMEHFYTLQGEGRHAGEAAYFLRLGGCDVGCVWCDVKESWNADAHPQVSIWDMAEWAAASGTPNVVITGGEPCMYDLTQLTHALKARGLKVWLETSGAYEIKGDFDWICLSPKKFKFPIYSALEKAQELKVIVYNASDFKWAEEHAAKVNQNCLLLLQPEWDKSETMAPMIVDYIKQNPRWSMSLQTHKFLMIP